jgi:hypothetical protein
LADAGPSATGETFCAGLPAGGKAGIACGLACIPFSHLSLTLTDVSAGAGRTDGNACGIVCTPSSRLSLTLDDAAPAGGGRGTHPLGGTKPGKSSSPLVRLVISCVEVSSSAVIQCADQ